MASRFGQVLILGAAETLFDHRVNWSTFEAAEQHGIPMALQLTSALRREVPWLDLDRAAHSRVRRDCRRHPPA